MVENENKQPAGSRRMKILQQSLAKKQAAFDQRLQNHFDDVRSANGQPLNDKRNGQATLNRWERQNDGLRTADKEIEKTQRAIEREQAAIDRVNNADIPAFLKPMIESGEITQWRKFPNRFFVSGVEKARIIWDKDKQQFGYAYLQGVKANSSPNSAIPITTSSPCTARNRSARPRPKPKSLRRRIANLKNRHSRQKKGRLKRRRGNRRKPWKNVCW